MQKSCVKGATAYTKFLLVFLIHIHFHYSLTCLFSHFCFPPDFPFVLLILASCDLNVEIKILTIRFYCWTLFNKTSLSLNCKNFHLHNFLMFSKINGLHCIIVLVLSSQWWILLTKCRDVSLCSSAFCVNLKIIIIIINKIIYFFY